MSKQVDRAAAAADRGGRIQEKAEVGTAGNSVRSHNEPTTADGWSQKLAEMEGQLGSLCAAQHQGSSEQRADARARAADLRQRIAEVRVKHREAMEREQAASPATETRASAKALQHEADKLAAQLRAIESELTGAPKLAKLAAPQLAELRSALKSKRAEIQRAKSKNGV